MKEIVIVGGGYAGFYTAWRLSERLRRGEARVTVIDPRPSMTYQPFLPEVAAGSVEARHVVIAFRRHLRRTRLIAGAVTRIDHAARRVTVVAVDGEPFDVPYDIVVVTAGAVTRTFPIPGLLEEAIGMKQVEEAVAIRDHILTSFDRASILPPGPERRRLLTVTFVGGGFSGVEGFGETLSLARALLHSYPELTEDDVSFHLVEATHRILPEVSEDAGRWVVDHLRSRGGRIHLDAQMRVRADLRVEGDDGIVPDAWAAGDDAAVPDLASATPGAVAVPNAQHAVRQGKQLAENLIAVLRGREPEDYVHHGLGVVATLGLGRGIFQYRRIVITGFAGWLMHRGYHVLAVPTWERKIRVLLIWLSALVGGRDIASLGFITEPRRAFVTGGVPEVPVRGDNASRRGVGIGHAEDHGTR